jgi:hypothetical protein|tara:strand:- start:205 stop:495 length:291 start_codon:yes stop_codon:yes gene_type:complete
MSVITVFKNPKPEQMVDKWLSQFVKNYSLISLVESQDQIPASSKNTKKVTFFDEPSIISDLADVTDSEAQSTQGRLSLAYQFKTNNSFAENTNLME